MPSLISKLVPYRQETLRTSAAISEEVNRRACPPLTDPVWDDEDALEALTREAWRVYRLLVLHGGHRFRLTTP